MPTNPNIQNVGDLIDDNQFLDLLNRINTQRSRRGKPDISIDVTDNNQQVDLVDYNTLVDGYNTMFNPGDCEQDPTTLPEQPAGDIIAWEDINNLMIKVASAEASCICDCNYCSCNANTCSCDCNNDDEGCSCNGHCSCNCNYTGCNCDCNYTEPCPSNCNSHCLCNCDYSECTL